jgi:hypothetical protein
MHKTSHASVQGTRVVDDVVSGGFFSSPAIEEEAGFEVGREPEEYCPAMFVLSRPEELFVEEAAGSSSATV